VIGVNFAKLIMTVGFKGCEPRGVHSSTPYVVYCSRNVQLI